RLSVGICETRCLRYCHRHFGRTNCRCPTTRHPRKPYGLLCDLCRRRDRVLPTILRHHQLWAELAVLRYPADDPLGQNVAETWGEVGPYLFILAPTQGPD